MELKDACFRITDEAIALLCKKHEDYGKGNISDSGLLGIAVRLHDKTSRLLNLLMQGKEPENESVYDTLIDTINYGVIGEMLRRGWWEEIE